MSTPAPTTPVASSSAVEPILEAYRAGHQMLLVSGRSLFDLHVNESEQIRPLRHTLMHQVKEEFGMATLVFNLALGARWNWDAFDEEERRKFEHQLESANVSLAQSIRAGSDHSAPPYEQAFRLLGAILQSLEAGNTLPPILTIWEFGEDLAPSCENGHPSDWVIQVSELLQLMADDYYRRRHPFAVVLTGTPEKMDHRVVDCFKSIPLCQPGREKKLTFIKTLHQNTQAGHEVSFEEGLNDESIANLTARTPNRSLEEAFREASLTGQAITNQQLIERKRADVISLSEGTLSLLDTERVRGIRLVGKTIERPLKILERWAQGLKEGDPHTPTNVILAGAPSSAKTDLALLIAALSQTPAYSLVSPKSSLVGETERRVRLQFRIFKDLSPAFGVVDEITEVFPMERNSMNLDSGASSAVGAEMLNALSDSSRAGRTLLIATTNCPWKVGAAMASRFLYVPVLSAALDDYPEILCAIAGNLLPEGEWHPEDKTVRAAATEFYRKGASPRIMRTLISSKIGTCDLRDERLLERAAADCAPQPLRERASAEYADLFAIRACSDLALLPWHDRISDYPLPEYLRDIVNDQDGSIDGDRLTHRIEELEPHVNV